MLIVDIDRKVFTEQHDMGVMSFLLSQEFFVSNFY